MDDALRFFIIGLGAGVIYALMALGIVVVYRGSGVVNFANGAFALVGAAGFVEAHKQLPTVPSVIVGVVAGALTGLVIQVGIMRYLRAASPLSRVVVTLAIMTMASEGARHRYGDTATFVDPILPSDPIAITDTVQIGQDRLILLILTAVLFFLAWLLYRFTRFGIATTGVAENEVVMSSLGWSPNRLAAINWAIGGAVSGFAGIMLLPIAGLSPTLTLTIIPALSAALVGNFASLPLTFFGGLLVGVLEAEGTRYISAPGWATAAPFVIIVLILVVRGKGLPLRSYITDVLPKVGSGKIRWRTGLVLALFAFGSLWTFGSDWSNGVTTTSMWAIIGLSLVVLTGYAGQLSLAQYALAGIGALIASRLADVHHVNFLLAMLIAVACTIPLAALVGLPALRARGVNLAVVTLGLSIVVSSVVLSNPDYTGGLLRGTVVPNPTVFGLNVFSVEHPQRYAAVGLVLFILLGMMVGNLRRGRTGRRFIAVRDNERAAASLGISVTAAKLYAFALAGGIAAVGGVYSAFRYPNVSYNQYDAFGSINVVLLTVIGGIGFISGSYVGAIGASGAIASVILGQWFDVSGWFVFIGAALLVLTVMTAPHGIVEANLRESKRIRSQLGKKIPFFAPRAAKPIDRGAGARAVNSEPTVVPPQTFEMRNVTMRFGAVVALQDVNLSIEPGEVVGLIGPNGAGKTTLIDVATGFHRGYEGQVLLDGKNLDTLNAIKRARRGLTRSFQSLELFEDLTVLENIRAASDKRSVVMDILELFRPSRSPLSSGGVASVREFQLQDDLERLPGDLSYAQRRLVGIARAVATSPSVLLLDEPAAGLDEASTRELGHLIRRLAREWQVGILLIEHDVSMVLNTCDKIVALDFGRTIASGTPDEIRNDPRVVEAYLGTSEPTTDEIDSDHILAGAAATTTNVQG